MKEQKAIHLGTKNEFHREQIEHQRNKKIEELILKNKRNKYF
jgi:hypothetical protein